MLPDRFASFLLVPFALAGALFGAAAMFLWGEKYGFSWVMLGVVAQVAALTLVYVACCAGYFRWFVGRETRRFTERNRRSPAWKTRKI